MKRSKNRIVKSGKRRSKSRERKQRSKSSFTRKRKMSSGKRKSGPKSLGRKMSAESFVKPVIGQGGIEFFRTSYGPASIETLEVISVNKSGKTVVVRYDPNQGAMSGEERTLTWRRNGWRLKGKTAAQTRFYSWYLKGKDYLSGSKAENEYELIR